MTIPIPLRPSPAPPPITRTTPLDDLPHLLRVREVAAVISVTQYAVRQMVKRGEIGSCQVGKRLLRIPREAVAQWLATQRENALERQRAAR